MGRKLTNEEFLTRLKELGRNDLIPLEIYKGRHTPITFKCLDPNCGHEWKIDPGNIFAGRGCPKCAVREGKAGERYTKESYNKKLLKKGRTDVILIGEYKGIDTSTLFKCTNPSCQHEWITTPYRILHVGAECPKCHFKKTGVRNRVNQEEFEKKVKVLNPSITYVGKYINSSTKTTFSCINGHIWEETPQSFYEAPHCPLCNTSGSKLISGVNDLASLRPDLVKYFKDKDLPQKIKVRSNQKVDLICPECGAEKKMFVYNLYNKGFNCNVCGDGISFPNKILRNLLKDEYIASQLKEVEIEWRPKDWEKKVFFDAMIKVKDVVICVEMQGKQHYDLLWNNIKDEYILERDKYKRMECKKRGIIEIEIDCRGESFESIREEILKSSLSEWVKLDGVDWKKVLVCSTKSIAIEACNMYNNSLMSVGEIAKKLGLARNAITRYLKRGKEIGICIYSKEDSDFRGIFNKAKFVYIVYKDGEFVTKQYGIDLLVDFFNKNFPEQKAYSNLLNQRAKEGWIIDGIRIVRKKKTPKDVEEYLKIYQKEKGIIQ